VDGDCWPVAAPKAVSASVRRAFRGTPGTIRNFKFPPDKRLHQPAEFKQVRLQGRRFSDTYFSISALPNHAAHPRLGLAIATKTFGSAVARNRIKRIARESFRLNQHTLPPLDVTVAARPAARDAQPALLRASLGKLWQLLSAAG
jgi:ribonuclease P protein component